MQVKALMKTPVSTIDTRAPVARARVVMAREDVRHLPVVDGATLVGVLGERDLRRAEASSVAALARYELPSALDGLRVGDVVARTAVTVAPDASVEEAARRMTEAGVEVLPVVEDGTVVGLLRIPELLTVLVRDLEREAPPGLRHVLGCVTSEPGSDDVLSTTLALACAHRASATLLYVLAPLWPTTTALASRDVIETVSTAHRRHALDSLQSHVRAAPDITVTCRAIEAKPTVAALGAARRDVDLLVVESRLAARLSRMAPCPVLGVPRPRRCDARR